MAKINFLLFLLSFVFPLSADSPTEIGTDAYVYGYPLITMEMTRKVMTNTAFPNGMRVPMGQFGHARTYPDAKFNEVTAPNADTLYSVAWLDLTKEPYILHLPDVGDRYYLMPMISAWTNVFADPGTRTTGTKEGNYAITGPNWIGTLPDGVKEYKSPTNMVWILGRTYCSGTPEDYKKVHALQDQYTLTPLSSYGKSYSPPKGRVDPTINMSMSVRDQVNRLDANTYFSMLAALMQKNPPAAQDLQILARMSQIGIIPGKPFTLGNNAAALANAPLRGQEKIQAYQMTEVPLVNGWMMTLNAGDFGTDYLERAFVASIGLGVNLPEDAVYPSTTVDSDGALLDGTNQYVLHFTKEQIPPVKGFWSLTLYNHQYFFYDNPLNRYTLSPRDSLKYNADGSLDLYIQNSSPGKKKESNWLPAPKRPFVLMLRLYWPEPSVLTGHWTPPAIVNYHSD